MNPKALLVIAGAIFVTPVSSSPVAVTSNADAYFEAGKFKEAIRLYLDLSEQGNAIAQHRLGEMYSDGLGTSIDLKKATHWFRMAARQGSTASQIELARILYEAKGAEQDKVAAYVWLDMAARSGNWKAGRGRNLISQFFQTRAELGEARSRAQLCYDSRYTICD